MEAIFEIERIPEASSSAKVIVFVPLLYPIEIAIRIGYNETKPDWLRKSKAWIKYLYSNMVLTRDDTGLTLVALGCLSPMAVGQRLTTIQILWITLPK